MMYDAPLYAFYLSEPGPRPPYYAVAEYIWGPGCNIDSDGDSFPRDASNWTELTIVLRSGFGRRVDVDPANDAPLVLEVSSESQDLARRAAAFLNVTSGGKLSEETVFQPADRATASQPEQRWALSHGLRARPGAPRS